MTADKAEFVISVMISFDPYCHSDHPQPLLVINSDLRKNAIVEICIYFFEHLPKLQKQLLIDILIAPLCMYYELLIFENYDQQHLHLYYFS